MSIDLYADVLAICQGIDDVVLSGRREGVYREYPSKSIRNINLSS